MTQEVGFPNITIGTSNWGMAVNDAFTEANRRLTLNGTLSPHPRPRTDEEDIYLGETPNWVGQVYIQTTPYTIWLATDLTPTGWKQFQEFVDFSADRLIGVDNPNHMVTVVEDADDIVTNEGLVPAYVGQRYLQSVGDVIWFASGATNTSWKRLSEFLVGWTEITEAGTHNLLNVLELEVYLQGSSSSGAASSFSAIEALWGGESTVSIDGVMFVVPGARGASTPETDLEIVQTGASIDLVRTKVDKVNNQIAPGISTRQSDISTSLNVVGGTGPVLYLRAVKTIPTDLDLVITLGAGGVDDNDAVGGHTFSNITEANAAEVRVRYR